jgi:hypothetical protein
MGSGIRITLVRWVPEIFSPGLKQQENKTDHSLPIALTSGKELKAVVGMKVCRLFPHSTYTGFLSSVSTNHKPTIQRTRKRVCRKNEGQANGRTCVHSFPDPTIVPRLKEFVELDLHSTMSPRSGS